MKRCAVGLLLAVLTACSAPTKVVRLDTGEGEPQVHVPRRAVEPVAVSEKFEELYASGERFADVMGEKAARAFVMLATVAMGNTAAGMATTLPALPGAGQAAVVAGAQLNIRWTAPALAQVESVALSAEGKGGAQAAPRGGPGEWVQTDEYMSESARAYQARMTGTPKGYVYRVKRDGEEVDFDGFDQGVLFEVKATGYAQWVTKKLDFLPHFKGALKLREQAERQVKVARETPIRWIVAEEKFAGALRKMFSGAGLPIEVVLVSPAP